MKMYFKHFALSHNGNRLIACCHLCGEVRLFLLHRQKSEAKQQLCAAISGPRRQVGHKKDAHCAPIKFVPPQGWLYIDTSNTWRKVNEKANPIPVADPLHDLDAFAHGSFCGRIG